MAEAPRLGTIYGTPKISPSDTAMCPAEGGCWSIIIIAVLLTAAANFHYG